MSAERKHIVSARVAAEMIGHKVTWFYMHRGSLERAGFPRKDDLLGGWSRAAIEHWLAKRAGLVAQSVEDQERQLMREAINARKTERHAVRYQQTR